MKNPTEVEVKFKIFEKFLTHQQQHVASIRWLLDPRKRAEGRTYTIASSIILEAIDNPNTLITLENVSAPSKRQRKFLLKQIKEILSATESSLNFKIDENGVQYIPENTDLCV